MSIRTRIARWLAPEWERMEDNLEEALRLAESNGSQADAFILRLQSQDAERVRMRHALNSIISRATSNPNSTVKAMVRIAQEALNGKEQANG